MPVRERVWPLAYQLIAHGLVAEVTESEQAVVVSGGRVVVSCRAWADDGDRLWFFGPRGRPLAAADDVRSAVVAVKGLLADRS
jgi:hypothetical protein